MSSGSHWCDQDAENPNPILAQRQPDVRQGSSTQKSCFINRGTHVQDCSKGHWSILPGDRGMGFPGVRLLVLNKTALWADLAAFCITHASILVEESSSWIHNLDWGFDWSLNLRDLWETKIAYLCILTHNCSLWAPMIINYNIIKRTLITCGHPAALNSVLCFGKLPYYEALLPKVEARKFTTTDLTQLWCSHTI